MEIHETKKADIVVLEPDGRLDTSTSRAFEDKIHEVLSAGERKFVVDLRELEYVSSAGLRVLLMLARRLQSKGGELILCSPTESVQEVLDISGFTRIFNIAPSQTEALKSINERSKPQQKAKEPAPKDAARAKTDRDSPKAPATDQAADASGQDNQDVKPPAADAAGSAEPTSQPRATTKEVPKGEPSASSLSPKASIAVSILKGTALPVPEAPGTAKGLKAQKAEAETSAAQNPKAQRPEAQVPEDKSSKDTQEPPKKDLMESVSGGSSGAASAKAGFWSRLMGRS